MAPRAAPRAPARRRALPSRDLPRRSAGSCPSGSAPRRQPTECTAMRDILVTALDLGSLPYDPQAAVDRHPRLDLARLHESAPAGVGFRVQPCRSRWSSRSPRSSAMLDVARAEEDSVDARDRSSADIRRMDDGHDAFRVLSAARVAAAQQGREDPAHDLRHHDADQNKERIKLLVLDHRVVDRLLRRQGRHLHDTQGGVYPRAGPARRPSSAATTRSGSRSPMTIPLLYYCARSQLRGFVTRWSPR